MKRHKSTDIFPLIEAYEDGTLSKAAFCKKTKLRECSLTYWLHKYRQHQKDQETETETKGSTRSFVQIQMRDGMFSNDFEMEIVMNDGKRIRFTTLVPIEYIQSILSIQ